MGQNKFLYFFLFAVFWFVKGTATESWQKEIASLSEKDKTVLEVFFRKLCINSQAGYVIWGNKPIAQEGIANEETSLLMLGNSLHRMSVYLKEGLRVWNKLACSHKSKNYYIVNYKKPAHGWLSFSILNKKAFLQTVEKNLPLFQYVLGPNVSQKTLLEKAIDPSLDFFSDVLKDDKVLIGIVLGFGTQNAIIENRIELIDDQEMLQVLPPFKPSVVKGNMFNEIPVKLNDNSINELKPSFGYSCLESEKEDLEKRIKITVDVYPDMYPPLPWFGYCPNSESEELLRQYIAVQPKIKSALESERFLELVLKQFFEGE